MLLLLLEVVAMDVVSMMTYRACTTKSGGCCGVVVMRGDYLGLRGLIFDTVQGISDLG
jgi:hypothetical protein